MTAPKSASEPALPIPFEAVLSLATDIAERITQLAADICVIAAPTDAEAERAAFVADQFAARGYSPETDAVGNVYARRGRAENEPVVLVLAHTDTVFPAGTPLQVVREGTVLRCPGIGDNSLSIAAMLGALDLLDQLNINTGLDIVFCANVGEEGLGNLRGARAAVERYAATISCCIAVDCDISEIVTTAVGSHRFRVTASGPGGHAFSDFGQPSAIHALAHAVSNVTAYSPPKEPKTTYNIGVIEGGTSINTIAAHASALVDVRSVDPHALREAVHTIKSQFSAAATDSIEIAFESLGDRPAGTINQAHPLVQAAAASLKEIGRTPSFITASTDANVPLGLHIPGICVGVAHGSAAHTHQEWVDVAALPQGLTSLTRLLMRVAINGADQAAPWPPDPAR